MSEQDNATNAEKSTEKQGRKTVQAGQFLTNDARRPPSFGRPNPRRG